MSSLKQALGERRFACVLEIIPSMRPRAWPRSNGSCGAGAWPAGRCCRPSPIVSACILT
ncbi:hypothetical protein WJ972_26250 [Achromobacter insuavis]